MLGFTLKTTTKKHRSGKQEKLFCVEQGVLEIQVALETLLRGILITILITQFCVHLYAVPFRETSICFCVLFLYICWVRALNATRQSLDSLALTEEQTWK